jgi:hypothetical protein
MTTRTALPHSHSRIITKEVLLVKRSSPMMRVRNGTTCAKVIRGQNQDNSHHPNGKIHKRRSSFGRT